MHSLNKHIYAVHVTVLLCVFSHDNEEKNASKTNYKLDKIWRNSNSDYDIYCMFNAFPLNLISIRKSPWNPHRPMEINHSPYTHPIPMGITRGIPGPGRHAASRASCCTQRWTLSVINWPSSSVDRRKYCQLSLTDTERATLSNKDRRSTSRGYFFCGQSFRGKYP